MEFEYTRNTMQGTFDFVALETRLHKIKEQLVRSLSLASFSSLLPLLLVLSLPDNSTPWYFRFLVCFDGTV